MRLLILLLCLSIVHWMDCRAVASIDFGVEYMKIAIVKRGVPMTIVLNAGSERKTVNGMSFRNGERGFEDSVRINSMKKPTSAFMYCRDLLGKRSMEDETVKLYLKRFPWMKKILSIDQNNLLYFQLPTELLKNTTKITNKEEIRKLSVVEIVAHVLKYGINLAETHAEQKIEGIVVTIPPFFGQLEKRDFLDAVEMTGQKLLQFITTDVATGLHHGIFQRKQILSSDEKNVEKKPFIIVDSGAGSTTAILAQYQKHTVKEDGYSDTVPLLKVLGIGSKPFNGGLTLTLKLRDNLLKQFAEERRKKKIDDFNPIMESFGQKDLTDTDRWKLFQRFFAEAEKAKRILSANQETIFHLEDVFDGVNFRTHINRNDFEKLFDVSDFITPIYDALEMSGKQLSEIYTILLMGGNTRLPILQKTLEDDMKPTIIGKSLNTDESAANGAVYHAAFLSKGYVVKKFLVEDMLIEGISMTFPSGEDNEKMLNRVLYSVKSTFPSKKVMSFTKHLTNFNLSASEISINRKFALIQLKNLTESIESMKKTHHFKGFRLHFLLNDSGLFHLVNGDASFEKLNSTSSNNSTSTEGDDDSTLTKIGKGISSLFSSKEEVTVNKTENRINETMKQSENKTINEEKNNNITMNLNSTNSTKPLNGTMKTEVKKKKMKTLRIWKKKLRYVTNEENEKKKLEKIKNDVESFIYSWKDKLMYDDEVIDCSEEEEREKIISQLTEANDWMEELPFADETISVFEEKLAFLQKLTIDLQRRVKEKNERPRALMELKNTIKSTNNFLKEVKNKTNVAHSLKKMLNLTKVDESDPMMKAMIGDGPLSATDIEKLHSKVNETSEWLESKEEEHPISEKDSCPKNVKIYESFSSKIIVDKQRKLRIEVDHYQKKVQTWRPSMDYFKNFLNETELNYKKLNKTKSNETIVEGTNSQEKNITTDNSTMKSDTNNNSTIQPEKTDEPIKLEVEEKLTTDENFIPPNSKSTSEKNNDKEEASNNGEKTTSKPIDPATHDAIDL
ncbi:hypothetical protein SNEBB_006472 [Seison nebaliae]|nr:hypothetical protein SNEBB_006472 [Seison nebaliae]